MPGIDKPTGRVVVLILLLILVAAALRGYLPAADGGSRSEPGSGRAALTFVIVALSPSVALMAFAMIARLRDPRAEAPSAGTLSEMLGGGKGRPSWRVLLIGLGVIVAWLLVATLLARLVVPREVASSLPSADQSAPPPAPRPTAPPRQHPPDNPGHTLEILLAYTVPLLIMIVVAAAVMARRRWRGAPPASVAADDVEFPGPAEGSELLARAAELGLAEMTDLDREPREAIIACYAAMERDLANVPGAVPQDFDTPTEVLARAVAHGVLRADNAGQLVNLFAEARFSPHVMNEGHRELAVRVLRLVLDELAPRIQRAAL